MHFTAAVPYGHILSPLITHYFFIMYDYSD